VLVNRTLDDGSIDACETDNAAAAGALARFLTELGHTRVAAVFGPSDTSSGRDRERGFRAALGQQPVAEHRGPFAFATGYDGLHSVLAARPTALFCANDVVAIGALNAARELGLEVPGSLTVVGFDDIAMAAWPVFSLTTARQDLAKMARTATSLLVERMVAPAAPARRRVIRATLVRRSSHARAAP
jgi:LacI family transcriptional regulator